MKFSIRYGVKQNCLYPLNKKVSYCTVSPSQNVPDNPVDYGAVNCDFRLTQESSSRNVSGILMRAKAPRMTGCKRRAARV